MEQPTPALQSEYQRRAALLADYARTLKLPQSPPMPGATGMPPVPDIPFTDEEVAHMQQAIAAQFEVGHDDA